MEIHDSFFQRRAMTAAAALCAAALLAAALFWQWNSFLAWCLSTQIWLHRYLITHLLQLNSGQYAAGVSLVVMTFLYGVLHAIGPGHGKFIVTAWLSTHQPPRGVALTVPFLGALVQGLSAIVFVFVLAIGFNLATGDLSLSRWYLEKASALFIAALGLGMMVKALRGHRHHASHAHAGCAHHHPVAHEAQQNWKDYLAIIIATGVRPCSGALTVLLFASVIGITSWGVVAVMTMALGTGLAVVVMAFCVRHFRERVTALWLQQAPPGVERLLLLLKIVGGAVVVLFAIVLFFTVVPVSANGDYIAAGC